MHQPPTDGPRRLPVLLAPLALAPLVAGCSAAQILGDVARNATRKFLVSTATENYDDEYTQDLERLVDTLITPASADAGQAGFTSSRRQVSVSEGPDVEALASADLQAIELEVGVFRELTVDGRTTPVPVADGDELRDGVGREGEGDNLRIQFRANVDCHVYAVWVDATAWASPIFPRSVAYSHSNPVVAGRTYHLPAGDQWFYLDGYRGVETLYFLASHDPLEDLEETLADLLENERPILPPEEAASVPEPAPITRGLAGVRPGQGGRIQGSDGREHEAASNVFVAQFPGSDLVITRWFHHR